MEWNEKQQRIIDYVENHLQREQEPVDTREISRLAGCSYGFFQKVFSYLNGISFSEYVRCRKLTLAGYDLKSSDKKVVDVSFQYGYDSPTSFTKAFHQFHGVTPKEARNKEVKLRVVPKMQVSVKQQYSWRLEKKPSFRLMGRSVRLSGRDQEFTSEILGFWDQCQKNGVFSRLVSMDTGDPKGLFGSFRYDEINLGEAEYSIMVRADRERTDGCEDPAEGHGKPPDGCAKIPEGCVRLPEGFAEIIIPEATWAVFDCTGSVPQAIQNGWRYLQEEWLVKYPFRHAECPELEWYSDGNAYAGDYLSQIWIPVIGKD